MRHICLCFLFIYCLLDGWLGLLFCSGFQTYAVWGLMYGCRQQSDINFVHASVNITSLSCYTCLKITNIEDNKGGKIKQSVQRISRVLHRNQQYNNGLRAYRVTCTQYYCLSYIGCKLCKTFSFFNIPSTIRGNKMWRCVALQDWLLIWLLTSFGYKNTNEQQY